MMKIQTAKVKEKLAIGMSNFYPAHAVSDQVDIDRNKWIQDRFDKNSILRNLKTSSSKKKLEKQSQSFYRVDWSADDYKKVSKNPMVLDVSLLSYPGSLLEIVLKDSPNLRVESEEKDLFEMWKGSSPSKNKEIEVGNDMSSKANKLMNHGYLIESKSGWYKLTDKGLKSIVEKVLGSGPQYNWSIRKEASLKKKADYDRSPKIHGVAIPSLLEPLYNGEKLIAYSFLNEKSVRDKLKEAGVLDQVQHVGQRIVVSIDLFDDSEMMQGEVEPSTNPFLSDRGQPFGQNSPNSNSPHEKIPYSVMSSFSNSKLLGIIQQSILFQEDEVRDMGSKYLEERKLNIVLMAQDDSSREKGLMHHPGLQENECAVFVFESPGEHLFWNKNVGFPIDVAAFGSDGQLVKVESLEPEQNSPVLRGVQSRYVIETRKGWFNDHHIKEGNAPIWMFLEEWR